MLYKEIVELYEKLDSTTKRLEKTNFIAKLLKETGSKELPVIMLMVQGKIFPDYEDKKIGIASKLVVKAISRATGASLKEIEEDWRKFGDLGDVAESLIRKRKQSSLFPKNLELNFVFESLKKLADIEGKGSVDEKLSIISDMFIHATPVEAKYIARTLLDKLRVGIGAGSMRDALVWAFFSDGLGIRYDKEKNDIELTEEKRKEYNEISGKIQHALDLTNDFSNVAVSLKENGISGLDDVKIEVGKPINVMLFQKAKDIKEAFEVVGKPAAFEYKMDGFRMQVHKNNSNVRVFTRRLEDVTEQFPEVREFVNHVDAKTAIFDAEAVGFDPKTKKYLPFQSISQRIKRKYDIKDMSERFPVEINIFDILLLNGKSLLKEPFRKRRESLEKITSEKPRKIVLAKQIITDDEKIAHEFYVESLRNGEEGVMAKNLEGIYKPGSRVGYGIKIKSILEPLDLVIVAAEYGEGKRSGMLTSYYLACSDNGELKEIGKVSTGLKELESDSGTTFKKMTALLNPLIIKSEGKFAQVKPEIVVEVGYEEIQKSTSYSSGYALRFPRFKRLRNDEKKVRDINTIEDVEKLYDEQRGRSL